VRYCSQKGPLCWSSLSCCSFVCTSLVLNKWAYYLVHLSRPLIFVYRRLNQSHSHNCSPPNLSVSPTHCAHHQIYQFHLHIALTTNQSHSHNCSPPICSGAYCYSLFRFLWPLFCVVITDPLYCSSIICVYKLLAPASGFPFVSSHSGPLVSVT
jgi:hypothetical protein